MLGAPPNAAAALWFCEFLLFDVDSRMASMFLLASSADLSFQLAGA
jgi:hypothetical protein